MKLVRTKGQKAVARRMRSFLHSETHQSEIAGNFFAWSIVTNVYFCQTDQLCHDLVFFNSESHRFCNKVQDAYTVRCVPQVGLDYMNSR